MATGPMEKLDRNYLTAGLTHADVMVNPENVMKQMDQLAGTASHSRGESLFSAIGDKGPNLLLNAMSKLRDTPVNSLPEMSLE